MDEKDPGALPAARKHLQAITAQSEIILNQQKEIDRLNVMLVDQVDLSTRLRQQLAALEERLLHLNAPKTM